MYVPFSNHLFGFHSTSHLADDPTKDPHAEGNAFKTLFISRLVRILSLRLQGSVDGEVVHVTFFVYLGLHHH
jgi:hypothetical protein